MIKRALALALIATASSAVTYGVLELTQERHVQPLATSAPAPAPAPSVRHYRHADFTGNPASADARSIADWVVDAGDNRGMPFVIVDKVDARVFVFESSGRLAGTSPVLLGLARGDDSVPGIGLKKISQITPDERTTPAGRFIGERGRNANGEEIVWVDYDAAISMHAVRPVNPAERRLQRLATPTNADNRISYGCINVPRPFFRDTIAPIFRKTHAVVYVLPETRPARAVFASYDVPASLPAESSALARAQ